MTDKSLLKWKIGISLGIVAGAYAAGYYTAPEKVRVETRTVEIEKVKKESDEQVEKESRKVVKEREITRPDGTRLVDRTITSERSSDRRSQVRSDSDRATKTDTTSESTRSSAPVTILGLYGLRTDTVSPAYGVSVSRRLFGPLSVGVFGVAVPAPLVGVGVGVTF